MIRSTDKVYLRRFVLCIYSKTYGCSTPSRNAIATLPCLSTNDGTRWKRKGHMTSVWEKSSMDPSPPWFSRHQAAWAPRRPWYTRGSHPWLLRNTASPTARRYTRSDADWTSLCCDLLSCASVDPVQPITAQLVLPSPPTPWTLPVLRAGSQDQAKTKYQHGTNIYVTHKQKKKISKMYSLY